MQSKKILYEKGYDIYHPNTVPLYMWVNIQYGHLSCNKKSFNSVFEGNVIIW
jgi:hypothetical protein